MRRSGGQILPCWLCSCQNGSVTASVLLLCIVAASPDSFRGSKIHQRHFEAAEKELRAVLSATPSDAPARLQLVRVLVELNRLPEALAEIERALSSSNHPDVRFQAGRVLRQL